MRILIGNCVVEMDKVVFARSFVPENTRPYIRIRMKGGLLEEIFFDTEEEMEKDYKLLYVSTAAKA